jgi:hypothetical protein
MRAICRLYERLSQRDDSLEVQGGLFMRRRRAWSIACLLVVGSLPAAADQNPIVCESGLPSNISASILEQDLLHLVRRSATVQQQCLRIASVPRVHVALALAPRVDVGARAQARITRHESGAIRVEITIRFGEDYSELVAHELEHVLEQIDGVDLPGETVSRQAWLLDDGAYETRRAIDAGVRARHEVDAALAAEPAQGNGRKPPSRRHLFD